MIGTLRARVGMLLTALALAVAAISITPVAAYATSTGTLQGHVQLASGAEYGSAIISIYTSTGSGFATTYVGDDRSFSFTGLAPGSYRLQISSSDAGVNAISPYWLGGQSIGSGPLFSVSADQVRDVGTISVPTGAVISGTVSNMTDSPLGIVGVNVLGADGTFEYHTDAIDYSDGSASYSVAGLRPGSYKVQFLPGDEYQSQYWNNKPSLASATVISVSGTQTISGIDAVLRSRPHIAGTVRGTSPSGTVSPLYRSTLEVYSSSGDFIAYESTESNGSFDFAVDPGIYTIEFLAPDGQDYAPQWYGGGRFRESSTLIDVSSSRTGIDATLAPASSISGTLQSTSSPITSVEVWAVAKTGSGNWTILSGSTVAADGTYRVDGLPAGPVVLQFQNLGVTGMPSSYYPSAATPDNAQVIDLSSDQHLTAFDATIGASLTYSPGSIVQLSGTSTRYLSDGQGGLITLPNTAIDSDFGFNQGTFTVSSIPASTTIYGPLTDVLACGAGAIWIAGDHEITDLRMAAGAVAGWPITHVPDALCNALPHGVDYQNGYPPLNMPQQVFVRARDTGVVYWAYGGSIRQVTTSQISTIDSYSPSRIITIDGPTVRARPLNPNLGAPELFTAPAVFGSGAVGSTWTVDTGYWGGGATGVANLAPFWLRCNRPVTTAWTTVPAGCTAIANAHSANYVSTAADAGKYLTAQVAASNTLGFTLAGALTTGATDGPVAPANAAAPTVSGSAAVGSTWTVSTGTWSGSPTPTVAPFWLRCATPVTVAWTTVPAGCTAISGARSTSYVSTDADAGKYLTAQVAGSNSVGFALAGALTTVVTDGPIVPANTAAPTVTGSTTVGSTWTVSTGTWSGTPSPTLVPFWLRCGTPVTAAWTTVPAGCSAIAGARSTTYVSTSADAGKYLTVQVAGSNSAGFALAGALTTVATDGPVAPASTAAPTVSGSTAVGSTWTVNPGTWTGTPAPTLAPFWLRCTSPLTTAWTSVPPGCTAISGARGTSYVSTTADAGKYLTAQVAATNSAGFALAGALTTVATVGPVAPANTAAPTVAGSAAVGSTWTVTPGTWTGTPAPTLAPFWLRCTNPVTTAWTTVPAGCTAITGARSTTYVSTTADAGKYLTAQVAGTNSAGFTLAGALTTVATG